MVFRKSKIHTNVDFTFSNKIKEKGKEICQRVLDTNMLFQDIEAQFILW